MAYTDFSLDDLEQTFGIQNRTKLLFEKPNIQKPSKKLTDYLDEIADLPVRTEKAKSEWIVAPILHELRSLSNKYFTIYSGESLNADLEKGLKGECDFILAKDTGSYNINFPILQIVEAKKNDIDLGIPQCAAQLLGAKLFNEKKGIKLPRIYGCVTTGNEWLFMYLADMLYIDSKLYYLNNLDEVLGIFHEIITYYKEIDKE